MKVCIIARNTPSGEDLYYSMQHIVVKVCIIACNTPSDEGLYYSTQHT